MAFVVSWTSIGPEMSVNLTTTEDVIELTSELAAAGRALNIRVIEDGEPVKVRALRLAEQAQD